VIQDLIYDVGMFNGNDTAYYLMKGYRVLAIEANPLLAQAGAERFKDEIAKGKLTVLNCGVSERAGHADFWVCDENSFWSSFDKSRIEIEHRGHPFHAVQVPCRTFENILKEYGVPFYLKSDIEGFDHLCVDALSPEQLPRYCSVENCDVEDLVRLRKKGFNRFKCISQLDLRQVRFDTGVPQSKPEDWRYEKDHWVYAGDAHGGDWAPYWSFGVFSGPFGEETDGPWQSFDETLLAWLKHKLGYAGKRDYGPQNWYDVHATRVDESPAEPDESAFADRFVRLMNSVAGAQGRPAEVWLFGAGRHTIRLLKCRRAWEAAGHRVAGIIDDNVKFEAPGAETPENLPVWSRRKMEEAIRQGKKLDAVIFSTDTFEDHFWNLTEQLRGLGVKVLRPYTP
jgi:FkbM family methyltransferase